MNPSLLVPTARETFWQGRTKIAPGFLRHMARKKRRGRKERPTINRSRWVRDEVFTNDTHRNPDNTVTVVRKLVWAVEYAP
ncbi:MAG TPA: hypothetical protein VMS92_22975 [Mycobacterium sp.]|nr:hypothetical protein [Mycobacterium sp.]